VAGVSSLVVGVVDERKDRDSVEGELDRLVHFIPYIAVPLY
jgi:hypothetical protein